MTESPTLAAALDYLRAGWRITICRDKIPQGTAWQYRIWTEDEIRAAFAANPDANVGIVLGESLIDIEWDNADERADYEDLYNGCERPKTGGYKTPRGGHQLGLPHPRLTALKKAVVKYGRLCIRLGGEKAAQSVVPPSAGRTWTSTPLLEGTLEPLPEIVVDRIIAAVAAAESPAAPSGVGGGNQTIRGQAALAAMLLLKISDGGDGSKRLYKAACRCRDFGLDDATAIATIRAYAAQHPFPKGWSDADIRQRLRDAEKVTTFGKFSKFRIDVANQDLQILTEQAWAAIRANNTPPVLFRFGGQPARVERGDDGEPIIKLIQADHLTLQLAQWCDFYRTKRNAAR